MGTRPVPENPHTSHGAPSGGGGGWTALNIVPRDLGVQMAGGQQVPGDGAAEGGAGWTSAVRVGSWPCPPTPDRGSLHKPEGQRNVLPRAHPHGCHRSVPVPCTLSVPSRGCWGQQHPRAIRAPPLFAWVGGVNPCSVRWLGTEGRQ